MPTTIRRPKKVSRETWRLPDDVAAAYATHHDLIGAHLKTTGQRIAGVLIHGLCLKHLMVGATSLLRLHQAPFIQETRSALEVAGIAHAIQHDSGKLKLFLDDNGANIAARKAAKRAFKPERIFPFDNPLLKQLAQSYNTASLLAHTNLVTLTQHIAEQDKTSTIFVLQDVDADLLRQLLIWCSVAHVSILNLVDHIFHDVTFDRAAFDRERRYVFDKIGRFKSLYDSFIASMKKIE